MSVPTERATRRAGGMAATMDHSDIRGLGTPFHLFLAGLPRSKDGDHRVGCPHRIFEGSPHRARASRCRFGGGFSGGGSVVHLANLYGIGCRSSRERLDLPGDIPDKATQLSSDSHANLVLWQFASHAQMSEAFGQAQLRAPGDVAYGFRLALLTYFQVTADPGAVTVGPGGFDEDTSGVCVTGLGNAALPASLAGGELRGHQTQVSHQGRRMSKATRIADLGYQGEGGNKVTPAQAH